MEFKCPKCGSTEVYAKPADRRVGIYCLECNHWICWTTYSRAEKIYKGLEERVLSNDKLALRKISRGHGSLTIRCSKCRCLLYNSATYNVEGQFNLLNANFCPLCGRELL